MTNLAIKLFSAVLLLSACHTDGDKKPDRDKKPPDHKVEATGTDSLAILSRQWKNDSLGCDHIRSIGFFEKLLKGYSLTQKNEAEMLKVLGAPNEEEKYGGNTIVIYYFSSICTAHKIVKGADKSSIRATFDDQKQYKRYDTSIE